MIARLLADPWRVFQLYAALLVAVVLAAGLALPADEWTPDGRPVVHESVTR